MAHTQYNVPGQTNLATVNTFFLGKPAPIVAERIWDTKAHAQSYIDDTVGSALAGIILRVTDDTTNNGAYLVEKDITATNGLKLSKFLTGTDSNTWRNIKVKTSASGTATEILGTSSTLPLTLTADSNITLTAVQDSNNEYTGEIKISASGGGNDTWRNIYCGGTSRIGTGTDSKAINFADGTNTTVSYEAAGTSTGQSGSADYFSIKINASNTATAADNILDGSNSGTEITYKPYTSQQSKLSFDTSNSDPTRTDRLNLNGYLYATYLKVGPNHYLSQANDPRQGLDMNNSDIINAKSILFNDVSDKGEGLHFITAANANTYDSIRAKAGRLYFDTNVTITAGSAVSGGNTNDIAVSASNVTLSTFPSISSTSDRYYRVETDTTTGHAVVNVPWTGGGITDSFKTIAVSGQSSVVADSSTDTLTLVAGTGMTITTNANTDSITFASSSDSSVEHMGVYYFVDTNENNIYRPFRMLCDLFSNIFNDSKTNDIHAYVNAVIKEYPSTSGYDGHIPLGAVILLYGMYLIQIKSSTGRFIYETNSLTDYYNYIIADNESSGMWGDSMCTTYKLLTACNIFLVTANWFGTLPSDINEFNAGAAGQYGTYTASGGSVTIPSVSGNANSSIWHKYTFDFANVAQGDLYSNPTTLSTINSFISAIKSGNGQQAETIFGTYFSQDNGMPFFNNKITEGSVPGMLVTVHHESSVAYNAQKW